MHTSYIIVLGKLDITLFTQYNNPVQSAIPHNRMFFSTSYALDPQYSRGEASVLINTATHAS